MSAISKVADHNQLDQEVNCTEPSPSGCVCVRVCMREREKERERESRVFNSISGCMLPKH